MNNSLHIQLQDAIEKFRRCMPGHEILITMSPEDMDVMIDSYQNISGTRPPRMLSKYSGITVQLGQFTSVGIKL